MKKNFLKWIVALLFAAFAGANMFAFEYYEDVEVGNVLYDIEVYTSSELARYVSRGNIWPEDSCVRYTYDNVVVTGVTENSFPKGKVCVIGDIDFEDDVTSITIPEKIDGYPVVGIVKIDVGGAKTLTLPKSLVFLGAIYGGDKLESIKIQSQKLYFPYGRDEFGRGYLLDYYPLPSLSEKSKSDLRKAGYEGKFPIDD